jgi:prevent-host-death family protein
MNKHHRVWSLQEAKAKFSEVVRLAQAEGPQDVTVHGKVAVTISAAAPSHDQPNPTVEDMIKAFQSCPVPDFEIPERPKDATFRDVDL